MCKTTWTKEAMRVVALISGGKDSCYNMMKCVEAGHEIVALANLQPQEQDELDSYMFQTVGHEGVSVYAEAMGLPLYRVSTRGCSVTRELQYTPTEGDEVEDLYQLLFQVKEELEVEAVSSGAVLSDYQRLRVENVCSRLQLVSLAYLWRRDQCELLQEMIEAGVNAVVIKVAAMGLTEKNLGMSINDIYPEALKLHNQYGINVCGEGGEYETYTLDCPLFKKQIIIDDSEVIVHSADAFAPVAYLKLKQLHLKEKDEIVTVKTSSIQLKRNATTIGSVKALPTLISDVLFQIINRGAYSWFAMNGNRTFTSVADQTQNLFEHLDTELSKCSRSWEDIVLVYLSLSDMSSYPAVNRVYSKYFPSKPPARVCVAMQLPHGVHVRMEVMVWRCESGRSSMHVQSYSEWAPANIGPYSQAYTVSNTVFLAGQIGLVPSTMVLTDPSEQPSLSLAHVQSVLTACHTHLTSVLCGMCYYTTDEGGWRAKETWKKYLSSNELQCGCPLAFLQVPALPRQACVEWHFIAVKESHEITYSIQPPSYVDWVGLFSLTESWCKELQIGCWMCSITCLDCGSIDPHYIFNVVKQGLRYVNRTLSKFQLSFSQLSCLRICIPSFGVREPLKSRDLLQFCRDLSGNPDEDIPVSFVNEASYLGHKTEITIQALKLDI